MVGLVLAMLLVGTEALGTEDFVREALSVSQQPSSGDCSTQWSRAQSWIGAYAERRSSINRYAQVVGGYNRAQRELIEYEPDVILNFAGSLRQGGCLTQAVTLYRDVFDHTRSVTAQNRALLALQELKETAAQK